MLAFGIPNQVISRQDAEDVWDEDSAYLEMLANEVRSIAGLMNIHSLGTQGARLREKSEKVEAGEEEDDDDDDEDEISEELGYFSALDNVDPYASFKVALTSEHILTGGENKCLFFFQPSKCKMPPYTRWRRRLLRSSSRRF